MLLGLGIAMAWSSKSGLIGAFVGSKSLAVSIRGSMNIQSALVATAVMLERHSNRRDDIYNILWAVVFGFATLNILNLAARRFEPNRRGMTFGELMAVLIVLLSVFLLGWELLSVFKIFPIKLQR
jgi:hypothetical protein